MMSSSVDGRDIFLESFSSTPLLVLISNLKCDLSTSSVFFSHPKHYPDVHAPSEQI
jgi:hypothetical protein